MLKTGLFLLLFGVAYGTHALADDPPDAHAFAEIPELPDDPAVKRLFIDEYLTAAQRLAEAMKHVTGYATLHIRTRKGTSDRYLYFDAFDDHLKVRRTHALDTPDVRDEALLINPGDIAMVRAPQTSSATPIARSHSLNRRSEIFLNTNWKFYGHATYSVSAMDVASRFQSGDWVYLRGHRNPSKEEQIVVHFTFRAPEWDEPMPTGPLSIVFDRSADWAIRQYYIHSVPFQFVERGEVEVQRLDSLGIVPKRIWREVRDIGGTEPVSVRQLIESTVRESYFCTFDVVAPLATYSADVFSLSSLGVTRLFGVRRWALILFGNLALLVLFVIVFVFFRLQRTPAR